MSYNSGLDLLCLVEQDNASSTTYGTTIGAGTNIVQFVATGGAADGSTITAADIAVYVGLASDVIGCLVECVYSATQNQGQRRKCVAFADAGAAVTLTCDRWDAQVVASDVFRIINRPCPQVAVDTGGAATFADASRNVEANDYWNGTYMEAVKSALCTETSVRRVTDFVQAGGVFTAAAGANATVGDLMEVWDYPEDLDGSLFECTVEPLKRGQTLGRFEPQPDARGMRSATKNIDIPLAGGGATYRSPLCRYLSSPMALQAMGGDLTAGAGGAVNSVTYGVGTSVSGHAYLTSTGDVFVATGGASPCIPAPSLRAIAINGTTIKEMRTYWPATSYARLLSAKQYHGDNILEEIYGIAGDWSFEGKLGDYLHCKAALSGADWYRTHKDEAGEEARKWRARRPTVAPVQIAGGRIVYLGVAMTLESFSVALNQKPLRKGCVGAPNQEAGWDIVRGTPTGQFVAKASSSNIRWLSDHLSPYDVFGAQPENSLLIQVGTNALNPGAWAFWAQSIQLVNVQIGKGEGITTLTADFQVTDHDTDTTGLPPWLVALGS